MSPTIQLTRRAQKRTWPAASKTSETISNWAAYLRYFGVLSFRKGHLRAQVPSKVSVSSAVRKMIKACSGVPPVKLIVIRIRLKINLVRVKMSAKYLMGIL